MPTCRRSVAKPTMSLFVCLATSALVSPAATTASSSLLSCPATAGALQMAFAGASSALPGVQGVAEGTGSSVARLGGGTCWPPSAGKKAGCGARATAALSERGGLAEGPGLAA